MTINTKCGIALLLLLSSFHRSFAQHGYNDPLKKKLDSIFADDQRYRKTMAMQPGVKRDSIAVKLGIQSDEVNEYYGRLQHRLDSINLVKVDSIFRTHGYPGKTLVGKPTNEAAYYVVQHSDKIEKYFPLIEKAGKDGELSFPLVAMMQDRLLKGKGEEQIYATQFAGCMVKDSATQEKRIEWFLWPVKDYAHVDERRKKAGFKETIAENAESQGIKLQVITLADAKKKYPWLFPVK
jgi:hypothetical protein